MTSSNALISKYKALKSDFRTDKANAIARLNAQSVITEANRIQSLQFLEEQRQRTLQRERDQQRLLDQEYHHQRSVLKQRKNDLLDTQDRILELRDYEREQMERERRLNRHQQELKKRQNQLDIVREETRSKRECLENKSRSLMKDMDSLPALSRDIGDLKLDGTMNEEQRKEMVRKQEEFSDSESIRSYRAMSPLRRRRSQHRAPRPRSRKESTVTIYMGDSSRRRGRSRGRTSRRSRYYDDDSHFDSVSGGLMQIYEMDLRNEFGPGGSAPNTYIEFECEGQVGTSRNMRRNRNRNYMGDLFMFEVDDNKRSLLKLALFDTKTGNMIDAMQMDCREFRD